MVRKGFACVPRTVVGGGERSERQGGYEWDGLISLEGGIFIVSMLEGWSLSLL